MGIVSTSAKEREAQHWYVRFVEWGREFIPVVRLSIERYTAVAKAKACSSKECGAGYENA